MRSLLGQRTQLLQCAKPQLGLLQVEYLLLPEEGK